MKKLLLVSLITLSNFACEENADVRIITRNEYFPMRSDDATHLLRCSNLPPINDDSLDFSGTYYRRVDLGRLASVIRYSNPIHCLDGNQTLDLLKMAIDLGAPSNALMTIGKELYTRVNQQMSPPYWQEPLDGDLINLMHAQAQPHLPSPRTLLQHLYAVPPTLEIFHKFCHRQARDYLIFNLSHKDCIINAGYNEQFASLSGLKELLFYIKSRAVAYDCTRWGLDLSGHHLDTFSLKEIKAALPDLHLVEIDLTDNWFYHLSKKEFDTHELPEKLILAKNRMKRIWPEVFPVINTARAAAQWHFNFELNLLDNDQTLFEREKTKMETHFYRAAHTIPERFGIYENKEIFTTSYKLALLVTSLSYLCYCIAATAPSGRLTETQTGAFFINCLGWYYLLSKRFDARLAKYSHPGIDSGNRHDRYIWPENRARLLA